MRSPDFKAIFDASPNPYMLVDSELRYVAANRAYLQITGKRLEELLERRLTDVFPHDPLNPDNDNARRLVASIRSVFLTGEQQVLPLIEYRVPSHSSEEATAKSRVWSATHTPLFDAQGQVELVLQHTVDVTPLQPSTAATPSLDEAESSRARDHAGIWGRAELVQMQNSALSDRLRDLRRIFDQAPGFMCCLRGSDHVIELANSAYQQLVGHRDIVGRRLRDALPELAGQGYIELLDEVLRTGEPFVGRGMQIALRRTRDAQLDEAILDFVYQPILDGRGQAVGIVVQGHDITEQKRGEVERERLLAEAERARVDADTRSGWLKLMFAQAPVAITVLGGDEHVIELANPRVCEIWGREEAELLGRPLLAALPELVGQGLDVRLERVRSTGKAYAGTEVLVRLARSPGGGLSDTYFDFVYQPLRDSEGRIDNVVVVAVDVTTQVLARKRAEAAQAELEAIFESFPDALYVGDRSGIKRVNRTATALLGYDSPAEVQRSVATVTEETVARRLDTGRPFAPGDSPFLRALEGHASRQDVVIRHRKSLEDRVLRSSAAPIRVGEEIVGAVVTQIDITDQQRAEVNLRRSEERLRSVVEASGAGIWEMNGVTGEVTADARVRALHHLDPDVTLDWPSVLGSLHPDDRERYAAAVSPALSAKNERHFIAEYRVAGRAGEPESWVEARGQALQDATTHHPRLLGTAVDITLRKQNEIEILQLAKVLDETRDFVGIADLSSSPIFVNEAGLRLIGLADLAKARAVSISEYFVEHQRAFVGEHVVPAALRDGYWEGELCFRHFQSGEEIPVFYTIFPLRDMDQRVTALATITRDLRAIKAADAERLRLLENEQAARAQAEQANRLKDEFLAMVSHELRTPLTAMLGWVQMLRSGALPLEKHARALDTIERNARSQSQLIEDLLDVSRIISGKLALELEPTDVAAVVATAIETVRPAADAKGLALEVIVEASGVVLGDGQRLQQVVWNLLSNAVKFTPQGGHVRVQVEGQSGWIEIRISDTGAGIVPELLPHVFERFRQGDSGTTRKAGGLGLGLSIVKHLVAAHKGDVLVSSDGEGKGSTFTVRLPLSEPVRRRELRGPDSPLPALLQAVVPPPELEGLHVLVVDDEEDTREYLRALLERCKATVTLAGNSVEALALTERMRPDVLVSDIAMPLEDGYVLIQKLRAQPEAAGGRTPAIALTAHARPEDRTRAMLAGFHNHVTKPIDPEELLAVLTAVVGRGRGR